MASLRQIPNIAQYTLYYQTGTSNTTSQPRWCPSASTERGAWPLPRRMTIRFDLLARRVRGLWDKRCRRWWTEKGPVARTCKWHRRCFYRLSRRTVRKAKDWRRRSRNGDRFGSIASLAIYPFSPLLLVQCERLQRRNPRSERAKFFSDQSLARLGIHQNSR